MKKIIFYILIFSNLVFADTPPQPLPPQAGHSGQFLQTNGSSLSWQTVVSSAVTSVGLSLPASVFSVSGSPVTSTGNSYRLFINSRCKYCLGWTYNRRRHTNFSLARGSGYTVFILC